VVKGTGSYQCKHAVYCKGEESYQYKLAPFYRHEYRCSCKLWLGMYSSEINRSEVMHVQAMTANGVEWDTTHYS